MSARAAALALAQGDAPWFWLDGEGAPPGERRVSYLGIASEVCEAVPGEERAFLAGLRATAVDPAARSSARDAGSSPVLATAGGFSAGWIAAFGYEFGVSLLGADPHQDATAPAFALRVAAVLVIDHEHRSSEFRGESGAIAALRAALAAEPPNAEGTRPSRTVPGPTAPGPTAPGPTKAGPTAAGAAHQWRQQHYEEAVEECRAAIRAGDAYVLCLTDTVERETELSPLELYERLRGGAVRGGVISIPGRALVSASPERFLSVRDGTVSTHPIKGTRPRGQSPEQDSALAAELAADPKERAENLMIVDLMRNDLARVCEVGSVRVERFLAVETHPRVHQLVSTVAGELRADLDVCDAIAACFPGGSMTGAPKRSAVEILAGLEAGPRGLYSGCFGWIDDSGDAELAMTIRGIELRREPPDGGAWGDGATARAFVGAGGGITIDSDPVAERRERDLKAAAMLAIL